MTKINRYHIEQLAYLLNKLRSVQEGDGTLLDHVMITYSSRLSDGNRPGRQIDYPKEIPMANLFVTMLDRAGIGTNNLGDSNGALKDLSDL